MSIIKDLELARTASLEFNLIDEAKINAVLRDLATMTETHSAQILQANALDLARMDRHHPMYDRLMLTPERIAGIAADIRNVASLPSPLNQVLSETTRPNGMHIKKISVPFGVIGIIYEARPNVSFDVFSLCFKAGSACILKGGHDAAHSNEAIVRIIREVLKAHALDEHLVTLLSNDREVTTELLQAVGYVDLIIPRGSKGLIDFVRQNARVPVIETGAGICHTYFDADGDLEIGANVIFNAKTRRVSVCNAMDCLIIHRDRLADLPALCRRLADKHVILYADPEAYRVLQGNYPEELLQKANDQSFGTEFLDYKMAIRTVGSLDEALAHIARYSSKHSEAIISRNPQTIDRFLRSVDAACVYANVSTAFTDGAQFGFGAEIGISTQKLHARGPMALHELTTYKYLITGNGQTRA